MVYNNINKSLSDFLFYFITKSCISKFQFPVNEAGCPTCGYFAVMGWVYYFFF